DEKDRQFVAEFDKIRLDSTKWKTKTAAHSKGGDQHGMIKQLFQAHGVALATARPKKFIAWLQRRPEPIQNHMMAALIVWQEQAPGTSIAEQEERNSLAELVGAACMSDPDPWRGQVFQAITRGDWKTAQDLVRDVKAEKHRPAFLISVAGSFPLQLRETRFA